MKKYGVIYKKEVVPVREPRAIYYARWGNNGNYGDKDSPYRTLNYVESLAKEGDTIIELIREGE